MKRPYYFDLYKERNIIERFFNKLKWFRRSPQYDKLLANLMGFVNLAAMSSGSKVARSTTGSNARGSDHIRHATWGLNFHAGMETAAS